MSTYALPLTIVAYLIAARLGRARANGTIGRPVLTATFVVLLSAALLAEGRWPGLLEWGRRDAGAVAQGQFHRLFTAFWLQSGSPAGEVFNIVALAMLGSIAEASLARWQWLVIYLAGALGSEVVGLWWQPVGAGNSVGYMSLAGALLALACARPVRPADRPAAIAGLAAAAGLCLITDIHGAALAIGCLLCGAITRAGMAAGSPSTPPPERP
ncbi:MAG: rhomboid family intramembrane serine protease [Sphingomonadales bacterium]|nr:rhomboid family intramembrane serine protease [Sphingomonadales bacterium]